MMDEVNQLVTVGVLTDSAPAPAPPVHRHPVCGGQGVHPGGDTWKLVHRHVGTFSAPDPDGPLRGSGE